MRLVIGEYEVEVMAKKSVGRRSSTRFNKRDTHSLLNVLSSYCYQGAGKYKEDGYPALGEDARKFADDIYQALEAAGVYDDIIKVRAKG